ncbi:hypothetical protein LTR95_016155, partial [Oleoguttula sp. CCFEE 5521]
EDVEVEGMEVEVDAEEVELTVEEQQRLRAQQKVEAKKLGTKQKQKLVRGKGVESGGMDLDD